MTLNPENLVALGRIARTQGHLGAVRLAPYFTPLNQFEELQGNELILVPNEALTSSPGKFRDFEHASLRILHFSDFSYHQEYVILRFEEIPDMTAAETLRGMEVYVRPEHLWPLPQDQFFPHEILDFDVVDAREGTALGRVADVRTASGAADYLVVERQERRFLVPMVRDMVQQVDITNRQIRVTLPPGLEEL